MSKNLSYARLSAKDFGRRGETFGNTKPRISAHKMDPFHRLVKSIRKRFKTKGEAYKFIGFNGRATEEYDNENKLTPYYAAKIIEAYNTAKTMPIIQEVADD